MFRARLGARRDRGYQPSLQPHAAGGFRRFQYNGAGLSGSSISGLVVPLATGDLVIPCFMLDLCILV